MNDRSYRLITLERMVVCVLLIATIGMRLGRLSWPPLSQTEAESALSASRSTRFASALDPSSAPATEPAYASATALLFTAFGTGDGLARAVPALAGIALLTLPLLLRPRIGPAGSVLALLAFGLSPALVMISRQAGGEALAVAALSLGYGLLLRDDLPKERRSAWLAGLVALALASGPSALIGILGIALGFLFHRALFRAPDASWLELRSLPWAARHELVVLIGVLLASATALGTRMDGIAGLAASLESWTQGWMRSGGLSLGPALVGLLVYEPVVLFGGVYAIALLRARAPINSGLAAWAIGALMVMVAYPARSAAALAWCVVPLALLAGQALEDVVEQPARTVHRPVLFALIGLLMILAVFANLQLSAYARGIGLGTTMDPALGLGLAIGAVTLGIIIAVLFGLGWSWAIPANAARVVLALIFLAQTVSAGWRLNFDHLAATARELWRPQAATIETQLLFETARGISLGQTGTEDDLPLRLEDAPSPVLAWTLRGFPLDLPQGALATDQPKVILRRVDGQDRALAADYIGQTFSIAEQKAWSGLLPSGLLPWLVMRTAATAPEQWLLLVRADVASFGESPAQALPGEPGG